MLDNPLDMFQNESPKEMIRGLAEQIAILDDMASDMAAKLQEKKVELEQLKTDLATLMIQSGMESCKLENGFLLTFGREKVV